MSEWHTIHSDDLGQRHSAKKRQFFGYGRGLSLAVVGVLLLVAGWGVVKVRLTQQQSAMRAELTQVILAEDTAHFLGNAEEAALYLNPTAPSSWQQSYWQVFEARPLQAPGQIQFENVDFDGSCATVTAVITGAVQIRTYCLSAHRWLRSPVPRTAWGDEQEPLQISQNIQIRFLERDRAFAEGVADDLQSFFDTLPSLALPAASLDQPFEIIIEPHDLHGPLIWREENHLILNSPWLIPAGELSGEKTVRLALAEALLQRFGLETLTGSTLPGAERFLRAVQKVVAAQLIFSPEEQAALYQGWQNRFDQQPWVSPFFTELLHPDEAEANRQADLAALLLVSYISQQHGEATLLSLTYRLDHLASWDELFHATLQRSTLLLEKEVARDVGADTRLVFPSDRDEPISRRLLFTGTLVPSEAQAMDDRLICRFMPFFKQIVKSPTDKWEQLACFTQAYTFDLFSQDDLPLVEFPDQTLLPLSDKERVPASCLPPGTTVEILGFWLEAGRRLKLFLPEVQEINPPPIEAAPSDTVAYLLEGTRTDPVAFYALSRSEGLQQILSLSETLKIFPLPIAPGGSPHFLIQRDLPACSRAWFAHYNPIQGVIRQWLAPAHPVQWVWRADRQDIMFFNPKENSLDYAIYEANETIIPKQVGVSTSPLSFLGWNIKAERLVSTASWFNEIYIGLFDMSSGQLMPMARPYYQPLQGRRLSPDGNWLAYLGGIRNILGPPDRLDVLELTDETNLTLIQVEKGEGLSFPSWSLYLERPSLAVLAGPVVGESLKLSRLLVASPDQPDSFTAMAEVSSNEQLTTPVFCSNGALLYRVERNGRYYLQHHVPGGQPQTLLQFEQPLWPIACP